MCDERAADDVGKTGDAAFSDQATHWQYRVGVTQILTPKWLASVNLEAIADTGYLGNTYRVARGAEVLTVHFPDRGQRALAELFGTQTGDEVDKFASCRWHEGPHGGVVLDDVTRHVVGRVTETLDSGDDGTDLTYGIGAQFRVWSLSIRAEYEQFDIDAADTVDLISLGVTWTFL